MSEQNALNIDCSVFEDVQKVLLAVSGGADSVAMVHVLDRIRGQDKLSCEFMIGHVNHCLRGNDSEADEAFVKELADSLSIPAVTKVIDVKAYANMHKLSIETAGRVVRLQNLSQMASDNGCDCIATAHHADDLAETIVHRLMRGTGFRGLCGIWPVSQVYGIEFIRPMLGVRRSDIIQYCESNQIQWREDESNTDISFTRNRIRHNLLPHLESESGSIVEKLSDLSRVSRRFQIFSEKRAGMIVEKGAYDLQSATFSIEQQLLKDIEPWIFYEVVHEILVKLDVGLRKYRREHFESIRNLIDNSDSRLVLPDGVFVKLSGDRLFIVKQKAEKDFIDVGQLVKLETGQSVRFGDWRICCSLLDVKEVDIDSLIEAEDAYTEWFDADRISGPIEVRGRREGDRFRPIGGKGEKKVGRFLQDGQLDSGTKQNAFIISDNEKILWLAPIRMAETAKITQNTRRILKIHLDKEVSDYI